MKTLRIGFGRQVLGLTTLLLISQLAAPHGANAEGPASVRPRIVNGTPASTGTYPWMVALVYTDVSAADGHFCGGTLIDSETVLTAAHCVGDFLDPLYRRQVGVVIGRDDLTSRGGISIGVKGVILHPKNDPRLLTYDFALLKLAAPVNVPSIKVASPLEAQLVTPGRPLTVLGWGMTDGVYPILPVLLQEAQIPAISDDECFKTLGRYFIQASMLCAGKKASKPDIQDQIDSAPGDSGGPLLLDDGGVKKIVGVVSWGFVGRPDRFPGVYARASAAFDWIASRPPLPPEVQYGCRITWDGEEECLPSTPTIIGTARVGETLTCEKGAWNGDALLFEYVWGRAGGSVELGSTPPETIVAQRSQAPTYVVTEADIGAALTCLVVAKNASGSAKAKSGQSDVVAPMDTGVGIATPLDPSATPGPVVTVADATAPVTSVLGSRCDTRRCLLYVKAEDSAIGQEVSSGVASVEGKVAGASGTSKRTRRSRVLTATLLSGDVWAFDLSAVKSAEGVTLKIVAVDRAGNRQAKPTRVHVRTRKKGK